MKGWEHFNPTKLDGHDTQPLLTAMNYVILSIIMNHDAQHGTEKESTEGAELPDYELQNILQEADDSLVVPAKKHIPQILLCPVGLVGAGKSTVLKPLSDRLDLVRISSDAIRRRLKTKGYNYLRAAEIAERLIKKYLDAGHSVAIDADCAGSARETILKLAKSSPVTPIWIHINPPESFILNKLRTYKHTWLFKDANEAIDNYLRRKPLHEKLDMPFLYTFDTSKETLPQQIDEAVNLIQQIK